MILSLIFRWPGDDVETNPFSPAYDTLCSSKLVIGNRHWSYRIYSIKYEQYVNVQTLSLGLGPIDRKCSVGTSETS